MRKDKGKIKFGGHPELDPDSVATMSLRLINEGKTPEDAEIALILSEGNEAVTVSFKNVEIVDRGCGELDHHVNGRSEKGETATYLMAKKLGILTEKCYQQLTDEIRRSDIEGITQPFTMCDFIKSAQRNLSLDDKQRLAIGFRIIVDTMEFRKRGLLRDNLWTQKILLSFLNKKEIPDEFQRYIENLANPRFQRSFDLAEILEAEKAINGEEEAIRFAKTILQITYDDDIMFYRADKAIDKTPYRVRIRDVWVIANNPEDRTLNHNGYLPKFGARARFRARQEGCVAVVIQRDTEGRNQIFFDTDAKNEDGTPAISDQLIEDVVAGSRAEEIFAQGRKPSGLDLAQPGTIKEIPEWHFFCPPQLSKKRPGRSILNGSLTAPDVPRSKIPLSLLFQIVCSIVKFQPLNWNHWLADRAAYYTNNRKK